MTLREPDLVLHIFETLGITLSSRVLETGRAAVGVAVTSELDMLHLEYKQSRGIEIAHGRMREAERGSRQGILKAQVKTVEAERLFARLLQVETELIQTLEALPKTEEYRVLAWTNAVITGVQLLSSHLIPIGKKWRRRVIARLGVTRALATCCAVEPEYGRK